jgi:large subunit ribosomal protein L6
MSRIGRKPITVPSGVELTIADGNHITVKGPRGTLSQAFHPDLTIARDNGAITVDRPSDHRQHRSLHGLSRTLLDNMVIGVTTGFTKNLDLLGVGYRAAMDGKTLVLNVGYSHQVRIQPADGVTFAVEGQNRIVVSGYDKQVWRRGSSNPTSATARTVQGQGHSVRRRASPPQGW